MDSSWTDDLIENPNGQYKFGSFSIALKPQTSVINRTTYSPLDWLGDIGGLIDALSYLLHFCLAPFFSFSYASLMMAKFFRSEIVPP